MLRSKPTFNCTAGGGLVSYIVAAQLMRNLFLRSDTWAARTFTSLAASPLHLNPV